MPIFQTEYEKVYKAIRDAIVSGKFVSGERLPQRKLAERFGTTTITVREALRFLENDGLIVFEPKWGAMVMEITPEKIYGRYIVREALEGMAARLASQNISQAEKEELLELAKKCDTDLTGDKLTRNEKANLHFKLHEKIVNITRCEELISSIKRINLHRILLSNAYHIDWHKDRPSQHTNLIKAIISGDCDLAETTMRRHVRDGYEMEMRALEEHKKR